LNLDCTDDFVAAAPWLPLDTISMASTSQWCFDLSAPLPPQRFYRAWQLAPASVIPSLDLYLIPALTLTGSPGDAARVDGINAVGPTDAWFTLATVKLTNSSQLYFDVAAVGQPQRLYRMIPLP